MRVARPDRFTAIALASCLLALGACGMPDEPRSPASTGSPQSLLVEEPPIFTAYFGGADFDADTAVRRGNAEFTWIGFRGPLFELDGREKVVDWSEPSDWIFLYNFLYAADEGNVWGLFEMRAGTEGLQGTTTFVGTRDPLTVAMSYGVGFTGTYELPGFAELPEVGLSVGNVGMQTPEEIRPAGGGR